MSLYLGKDTIADPIMVISNSLKSVNTLKQYPLNDLNGIVFHSKASYMFADYEEISLNVTTGSFDIANTASMHKSSSYMLSPNGELRSCFIFINNTYVNTSVPTSLNGAYVYFREAWSYDVSNQRFIIYTNKTGVINVKIIYTNFFNLTYRSEPNTLTGDIKITKDSIKIGGTDYFNKKWLVTPALNSQDLTLTILGKTYQLINSVTSSGVLEIMSSANNGGMVIKKGGKTLLDSSKSSYKPLIPNSSVGVVSETRTLALTKSSGDNSPSGYDMNFTEFNTFIPYSNSIALIRVVFSNARTSLIPMLIDLSSNSNWIDYTVGFVPSYTGVGFCNVRVGVRFYNNKIRIGLDGSNCCSDTNDAFPYTMGGDCKFELVYVT